jgi:hypothetical protein
MIAFGIVYSESGMKIYFEFAEMTRSVTGSWAGDKKQVSSQKNRGVGGKTIPQRPKHQYNGAQLSVEISWPIDEHS